MWITTSIVSGNLVVNDESDKIFADDSTDAEGHARFQIPSISGCGKLRLALFVSGVVCDTMKITVRTTDSLATTRVTGADWAFYYPDLNFSGARDSVDKNRVGAHLNHWHRNALLGTPVRRTNLAYNTYGDGRLDWEPNDSLIAFSYHVGGQCRVAVVSSDPTIEPKVPHLVTYPVADSVLHDYNPSWSPRGFEITFDRGDIIIYRKGVPGLVNGTPPDTGLHAVVAGVAESWGAIEGAISPNGQSVVYVRYDFSGATVFANLYTVPIGGGTSRQITSGTNVVDHFPTWSPDGRWVYFQRYYIGHGQIGTYSVPADSGGVAEVYVPSDTTQGAQYIAAAPDGRVTVLGLGGTSKQVATADPNLSPSLAIANYLPFSASLAGNYPRVSTDGTRAAFVANPPGQSSGNEQVWAIRRNMNQPPAMAIDDTVITAGDSLTITPAATDPESDNIVYNAYFLPPGASWDSTVHRFAWRSSAGDAGKSYWVKFRAIDWNGSAAPNVGAGGTASRVVKISVIQYGRPMAASRSVELDPFESNPSRVGFAVRTAFARGETARLRVYDARGRLVAIVDGKAGDRLIWRGHSDDDIEVRSGLYFYKVVSAHIVTEGKWVYLK